jgi:peptidoglycan/LPS O-acetylase OafA/YrhL
VVIEKPAPTRIPALDGLRGLAILLVLVWHYTMVSRVLVVRFHGSPALVPLLKLISLTWSGVDLFFVLSGFLLGGILLQHVDSPTYFRTFFIRRACRILPLYFAWVFILIGVTSLGLPRLWPGIARTFAEPVPIWSHLTFTQNLEMSAMRDFGSPWLGATWSLAVEEQFYLFLPLMIRFTPRRSLPLLLVALILAAQLFRIIVGTTMAQYVLMPSRMDALLIGVLGAWAVQLPQFVAYAKEENRMGRYVFVVLALGMGLAMVRGRSLWASAEDNLGWVALFYGALVYVAATSSRGFVHWLCTRAWLRKLGLISFGVYIFHGGVDSLVYDLLRPANEAAGIPMVITIISVSLGVTLLLAALSYRFFEGPILRFGHRHKW